jgi:isopenicillin N synthase-like dioxygenase
MVRDHMPSAVDVASPSWTAQAFETLKQWGYVRLRLTPAEASFVHDLYAATDVLFNDTRALRQLEVPDDQIDDLDWRSGYVWGRSREIFELHCGSQSAERLNKAHGTSAREFVRCLWRFSDMCDQLCLGALEDIPTYGSALSFQSLLRRYPNTDNLVDKMLRVYRYSKTYDRPDGDIDAHYDMGLLTIIPRSTSPGLMIQPHNSKDWISVEEHMEPDEALLFGGMTLARLTGIPALLHGVFTNGKVRFSAPFFQRVVAQCILPASPGHPSEKVSLYNRRLRDAENDELRSDGSIVSSRRRADSRERTSKPKMAPNIEKWDPKRQHESDRCRSRSPLRRRGYRPGQWHQYG